MAVLVTDSMSLIFLRLRPHRSWCIEGSNVVASTTLPSYIKVSPSLVFS
jgi:hypothetical protein